MKTEPTKKTKKPWPTKAVMEQVYKEKLWGGDDASFYSGDGSHRPELVNPYVDVVQSFLTSFENPLTVCDLGCGDFNIGKRLVAHAQKYIAVDIVEALVDFNKKEFQHPHLEFQCLDIANDDLPIADCVILRQVLQHLSNVEIQKITEKLHPYTYVIVTEHLPQDDFEPNLDIISGQGTRLKKQSGVDLLKAPFHFKAKEARQLLVVSDSKYGGRLVTTLFEVV